MKTSRPGRTATSSELELLNRIPQISGDTQRGRWLSPRRKARVDVLINYITNQTPGKIFLDSGTYAAIRRTEGLERHEVDAAADDAYTLALIDMRVGGISVVIELMEGGGM